MKAILKKFLSVADAGQVQKIVEEAIRIKANPLSNTSGKGKRIGLLFMNPSLRTRVSTQVAAQNLGLDVIVLNTATDGWMLEFEDGAIMNGNTVEHVKDAARVLGRYFDVLGVRTFPQLKSKEEDYSDKVINAFVQHSSIPVLSLESATRHPLQSLADALTIFENSNSQPHKRQKVVLTWAPHVKPLPQCVANSFAEWMNAWEFVDFSIAHPAGYELDDKFAGDAKVYTNQDEALKDADFVYVKNWSSVSPYGKILPVAGDWMLTNDRLKITNNGKVMHCLPVRRNVELADEILDGENSLVTEQAANRVWAAQAALARLIQ